MGLKSDGSWYELRSSFWYERLCQLYDFHRKVIPSIRSFIRLVVIEKAELELDGTFHGEIYGNKDCGDRLEDALYTASLLEFSGDLKGGRLGLTRSQQWKLSDWSESQGECTFPANHNGIFRDEILGKGCSLKLTLCCWSDED